MSKILELQGVCKAFGGVVAAENVNFTVERGEIMGLIGPNGAGKSTTLNLISGIYDVDAGKVLIADQDVTNMKAHLRSRMGLGRTFQTPRFLQRSNIRENLELGTDLADQLGYFKSYFNIKGNAGKNFEAELNRLLDVAGFSINLDDDISSLSYGQMKLLEIVRAMLANPSVMLVDEPAAGLNNKEIENANNLLHLASEKRNMGIVLIEHQMDMVLNICHNVSVLNFGRIIAQGTPEEALSNDLVIEAYLGKRLEVEDGNAVEVLNA